MDVVADLLHSLQQPHFSFVFNVSLVFLFFTVIHERRGKKLSRKRKIGRNTKKVKKLKKKHSIVIFKSNFYVIKLLKGVVKDDGQYDAQSDDAQNDP